MIAYIGLGSNRGPRVSILRAALAALPGLGVRVRRVSRLRWTAPVGATGRARFLNAVAEVETDLLPLVLLRRLRGLERRLGRHGVPGATPKTPRTLDLDIIFYGHAHIRTPALTVPHPRFAQRRFVLNGLADLVPISHLSGQPLAQCLRLTTLVQ